MTEYDDDDEFYYEGNARPAKGKKRWIVYAGIALAVILVILSVLYVVGGRAAEKAVQEAANAPVATAAPVPSTKPATKPKPTAKPALVAHKVSDVTGAIDKLTNANCEWIPDDATTFYQTASCDDAGLYVVYTTTDVRNYILMAAANDDLEGTRYVSGPNWIVSDVFSKTRGADTVNNIAKLLGGKVGQF